MADDRLISLNAALDAFKKELTEGKKRKYVTSCSAIGYEGAKRILESLPSAQPDLNEWCTDCKEYDKERHCCPQWNRVIRQTVEDMKAAQPGWIPCSERLPGKYEYVLLTCERNGKIAVDFGCISPDIDGDVAWWIAAHDLIEGWRVLAWCRLPEPWKGGEK